MDAEGEKGGWDELEIGIDHVHTIDTMCETDN